MATEWLLIAICDCCHIWDILDGSGSQRQREEAIYCSIPAGGLPFHTSFEAEDTHH